MICPDWQYPHCSTCSASQAFWTGWPPSGERPSMVVTRLPSTTCIRVTQGRVAWPSRCTVQEPHIAIPQPYFGPVSLSFSRSTHSNVSSGCAATSICLPLSMKIMRTSPEPATLIPPPGSLVYWLTAMDIKGLTGAETLLRVLAAMGVERIFASPGSEWAPIWEHLAKPYGSPHEIPRYLSSRHEEVAVGMASGYTKATGKLPAVMIHTTVGALHATMALRAALHEHVPMVVLAGESIGFGEIPGPDPGHQWLRVLADTGGPARLVGDCVKWSYGMNTSALLPSAISELARLLAAAANPVIVTEEAGRTQRAVEHLVVLAERLGAPVVEGWHPAFVNFPRQHPLYGGIGRAAHLASYLKDADLVFLLAAVAPWHPPSSAPGPATRVVVLSDDPVRSDIPFWGYRSDLAVTGDLEASLGMLVERVNEMVPPGTRSSRAERWRTHHQQRRDALAQEGRAAGATSPIDTRWVVRELNEVLPDDATVVDETITHRLDIHRFLDRLTSGRF